MKKFYIVPESCCLHPQLSADVLVVSPDVNDDGTQVKVDDDDESGNAWSGGHANNGLWDDSEEME